MENNYEYTKYAVVDSQQGVVFYLVGLEYF